MTRDSEGMKPMVTNMRSATHISLMKEVTQQLGTIEAECCGVWHYPGLHSEFPDSQSNIVRPCLKATTKADSSSMEFGIFRGGRCIPELRLLFLPRKGESKGPQLPG